MNGQRLRGRNRAFPYLLLAPCMVLLTMFAFWPFLKSIYLTFTLTDVYGKPQKFVGLFNWTRLLVKEEFISSLKITFIFALMMGVGTFVTAMIFALLSVDERKGGKVYQIMYSLPMSIASVPASSMFIFLMSRSGIINRMLGTQIEFFSEPKWALIAVAVVSIWSYTGSSYLYLLVGFRNVPKELQESALLDGAGFWQRVFNVLIPVASPQIFYVIFLNIVTSFKAFAFFKLLTGEGIGGSTKVLILEVYQQAFRYSRFETACVYAVVLFVVIFITTRIQFLVEKRMVHYQ